MNKRKWGARWVVTWYLAAFVLHDNLGDILAFLHFIYLYLSIYIYIYLYI